MSMMLLEDWMNATCCTDRSLAATIGVTRSHVYRMRKRKIVPGLDIALKIRDASNGAVTLEELLPQRP